MLFVVVVVVVVVIVVVLKTLNVLVPWCGSTNPISIT